ncbi:MAG: gliding motility lipoprotein GldH [Marinilabiliaceae bacterium]|nr:gliding motility lipoprotein GldH [Marinilabiliaceae bacterium]
MTTNTLGFDIRNRLFFIVLSIFVMISCGNNVIYESQVDFEKGWHKDTSAIFNVFIDDTVKITDFLLTFKHTDNYPYRNLWLFVSVDEPENNTHLKDTLELYMAHTRGEWFGKKKGKNYYVTTYYKHAVKTAYRGNYKFEFRHGMRIDIIDDIKGIEFKIVSR